MALYRPQELLAFLESEGAAPLKFLSQNFLIDGNIVKKIIALADIQKDDLVFEIGPGPGVLTEAMVDKGARVIACELDKRFAKALQRLGVEEVVEADILKYPLEPLFKKRGDQKIKVVSNLPYHLTTPILAKLLPHAEAIASLTVMVQKEVADRIKAKSGSPCASHLKLLVDFYSEVQGCFTVGRRSFYPAPKVDSAVIKLDLTPGKLQVAQDQEAFFELTRFIYTRKRKTLANSLKAYGLEVAPEIWDQTEISPKARPETLGLGEYLKLFQALP